MGFNEIEGLQSQPLKQFRDDRGALFHMMRTDSSSFLGFGEVYFSFVNPGVVKGWKFHNEITQNFAVPVGNIKLVVYDSRKESTTFGSVAEIDFGIDNYRLITIPPRVWYSFKGLSNSPSMIVNLIDKPYDPEESEVISIESSLIPYKWMNV